MTIMAQIGVDRLMILNNLAKVDSQDVLDVCVWITRYIVILNHGKSII
jgi:hypothetical protein